MALSMFRGRWEEDLLSETVKLPSVLNIDLLKRVSDENMDLPDKVFLTKCIAHSYMIGNETKESLVNYGRECSL